ncbi:hypothetical protein EJB05_09658, partial [Eragrostis curvula]
MVSAAHRPTDARLQLTGSHGHAQVVGQGRFIKGAGENRDFSPLKLYQNLPDILAGEATVIRDGLYWLNLNHNMIIKAPALKSLRLIYCYDVCQEAFMEAIRKFPMLEELELSLSSNVNGAAFGVVGESCPHLKRFRLNKKIFIGLEGGGFDRDDEARGIAKMHELRSLQLFNCEFTDTGLTAILDGCPHLESLDIRRCFNVTMDATAIRAKCAMMKTLKLPHDSTASYEFQESEWTPTSLQSACCYQANHRTPGVRPYRARQPHQQIIEQPGDSLWAHPSYRAACVLRARLRPPRRRLGTPCTAASSASARMAATPVHATPPPRVHARTRAQLAAPPPYRRWNLPRRTTCGPEFRAASLSSRFHHESSCLPRKEIPSSSHDGNENASSWLPFPI